MIKASTFTESISAESDPIEMQVNLSICITDSARLYKAATERWLLEGDSASDAREIFGPPEAPNLIRCVMEFVDFSSIPVEIIDWKEK